MCRADVAPQAEQKLAEMLTQMGRVLAGRAGVDPSLVRCGPVDFGAPDTSFASDTRPATEGNA